MKEQVNRFFVKHKIWIEDNTGEGILGDGKWELLKAINRTGSLKTAICEMGWGYRSTWDKLRHMEEKLGFKLIEKSRGGTGGGGQTKLTPEGEQIVECFRKLHDEVDELLKEPLQKFLNMLNENKK